MAYSSYEISAIKIYNKCLSPTHDKEAMWDFNWTFGFSSFDLNLGRISNNNIGTPG